MLSENPLCEGGNQLEFECIRKISCFYRFRTWQVVAPNGLGPKFCVPHFLQLLSTPTCLRKPLLPMEFDISQKKVQVCLSTRDPILQITDAPTTLLVPISVTRHKLSILVNDLLHLDTNRIPFNILINGEYLANTIHDYLKKHGINAESILNLEYTRALVPPLRVTSFEHDDWVTAVDVLSLSSPLANCSESPVQRGNERLLSASYDGLVRVWSASGEKLATSKALNNGDRTSCLRAAKWLSGKKLVAAGLDSIVRVYEYDDVARTITASLELVNHHWGIEDIAVHGPSAKILAASADSNISLFSGIANENPITSPNLPPALSPAANKRHKLSMSGCEIPSRGALATLSGHSSPVASVIFKPDDSTVAHSASHDHTLKTWDLTTSTCVDTRSTAQSLLSICSIPSRGLLAAGTSSRHITLIDPRISATQISVMTLRGHKNAVVSLDTDPSSEYNLASASHDGTVRIWDLRNASAGDQTGEGMTGSSVYTIYRQGDTNYSTKGHGEGMKVFSLKWDQSIGIVSAGEDKRVQINRALP